MPPIWCVCRPSNCACSERWATDCPRSYSAQRRVEPEASVVVATLTMSTDADRAHTSLNSISPVRIVSCVGVPRRPTTKRDGCVLLAEGAQRAASSTVVSCCSVTVASGSKARVLHRCACASLRGTDESARREGAATDVGIRPRLTRGRLSSLSRRRLPRHTRRGRYQDPPALRPSQCRPRPWGRRRLLPHRPARLGPGHSWGQTCRTRYAVGRSFDRLNPRQAQPRNDSTASAAFSTPPFARV